jgi:flagellar biosynthesis protein FlhA
VLSVYTIATVGDGLVSQLPALMISDRHHGMIVNLAAASDNNLRHDLSNQLISYPAVLFIITGVRAVAIMACSGVSLYVLIPFGLG